MADADVRTLAILACSACGRIAFDPIGDAVASVDTAPADAMADAADSDLLLHFDFEASTGLLYDSSPAHHAATCTSCPTSTTGQIGANAAAFAGAQCITIPDTPDLHPAAFTFAEWVNSTASQRSTTFSRPLDGATDTTNTIEIYVDVMNLWHVGVDSTYEMTPSAVTLDAWHHVAGTFDGTTLTAYLDGGSLGTTMSTATYAMDDYLIGCDINIGNQEEFFAGAIDDVRFYDRVLSATEIAALAAM